MSYTVKDADGNDAQYVEGTDGQTVTIRLLDADDVLIAGAAIVEVLAMLESLDAGTAIFTAANCTPGAGGRGSLNGAGELVITFSAADMVAVGTRPLQGRRLTIRVEHSGSKVWYGEELFPLVNRASAPFV